VCAWASNDERLRDFRIKGGLSQEQTAVYAGRFTRKSIVRLENARFPNPHLSTLLRRMTTYDVSCLEELLGTTPGARLAAGWERLGRRPGSGRAAYFWVPAGGMPANAR
jgi:hypothetical protein